MEERHPALKLTGLLPALTLLFVLFTGAIAGAARTSLLPLGGGLSDVSLDSWRTVLSDPSFTDALLFTLKVTVVATIASAVLGLLLALLLRRRSPVARVTASFPVPVPHLLVATIAVLWLAPGGIADRLLGGMPADLIRDPDGLGIILVYVYKEVPFIALLLLASLGRSVQLREEAVSVLGASRRQTFAWVLWPAIRAPLILGSVIVAAFTIGSFEVPLAVGPTYPQTLAAWAYQATQGDLIAGEGAAAVALLVAGAIAFLLALVSVPFARSVEGE